MYMLLFCVVGGEEGDIVGNDGGLVVWEEISLGHPFGICYVIWCDPLA